MSETVRTVLTELLRLYDWRFELARMEVKGRDTTKLLNQYGREKKAAWEAARRVLATPTEDAGLSRKPASPLPWTLVDNVISDANGEPVCGLDLPEFDADYIWQAVQFYSECGPQVGE